MTILFFGDSITWGAWDEEGGWVNRVKKIVDKKIIDTNFSYYHDIYNVGISGDLSTDLLERFEFETNSRIDQNQDTVFVFAIGANDAMFDINKKVYRTDPNLFLDNINKLIQKAKKFSNKIVFVGLFPVDDNATIPAEWPQNEVYKNIHTSKYNDLIKDICESERVEFINLFDEFINKDYQKLLAIDGLHPNSKGHHQISEVVKELLTKNKLI